MNRYDDFSNKIKAYRSLKNDSLVDVAVVVGIDKTYLSKLENGHERPSTEVLNALIRHYSLSVEQAAELFLLAGYQGGSVVPVIFTGKEVNKSMAENNQTQNQPVTGPQMNLNGSLPVFYSDSILITTNPYGVLLDFAVNVGPTGQQNVVSRIGMSKEHAKALANTILAQLSAPQQKTPVNTLKN